MAPPTPPSRSTQATVSSNDVPVPEPDAPALQTDAPALQADEPEFDDSAFHFEGYIPDDDEAAGYVPLELDAAALPTPIPSPVRGKGHLPRLAKMTAKDWPALAAQLPVTGLAAELARQSEWVGLDGNRVRLRVAIRTLAETSAQSRLCTVLSEHFGTVVQLHVDWGSTGDDTAHAVAQAQRAALQQQAEQAVQTDPFVMTLIKHFDARVIADSIRPGLRRDAA